MNLKRLRGIATVALITIAAALFAGCSNSIAGSVDSGTGMATLSLSATGIPNDYAEQFEKSYPTARNVAARSITPNDPYDISKTEDATSQSNKLTFYLSGTSATGKKLKDTQVKVVAKVDSNPVVYEYTKMDNSSVSIDSVSWNLVLTAYKSYTDADNNEPVLRGFCSIDLRNGSGTANFTLSPENLTTEGSVKITGKFYTHDNVASYTMGIYKKDSTSEKMDEKPVTTVTADALGLAEFEYELTSIAPGSYLYKMIFRNAANVITGSFIDTLVVNAGNALERDIGTLNVINKKPGAPDNFTANLVKSSEKPDGTYQVKLSWESGGGETNFEVELTEYSDNGTNDTSATKKIYGMKAMDLGTPQDGVIDFRGSDVWAGEGGAMTYGDTEAFFKLKLGVVYEVRIRARNYVGISADATTGDWTKRKAGSLDADGNEPYGSEKINRMKIEYNLNGGKLKLWNTDTSIYDDKEGTYTEYQSWKGSDLDLLEIDIPEAGTNTNRLKKGDNPGSPFSEWRTNVRDDTSGISKADYKNLSVTAFFGSSIEGTVSVAEAKKDVKLSDIEITYGTATSPAANSVSVTTANATYTIPKETGSPKETTNLRIVLKTDVNTYTNIRFELSYEGIQTMLPCETAATNACTLVLDDYVAGKIQVRVIADTANATSMSQTLTFDLQ